MKALLSVAVLLALASGAAAQRLFPIVELTDEALEVIDLHDASIDDWREVVGEPTLTALDFETDPRSGAYDPSSMDFRIWMAWHDATDRIFVAMERSDDVYVNDYGTGASEEFSIIDHDSSIWFSVDGDHSGGQLESAARLSTQTYVAIAEVFDDEVR